MLGVFYKCHASGSSSSRWRRLRIPPTPASFYDDQPNTGARPQCFQVPTLACMVLWIFIEMHKFYCDQGFPWWCTHIAHRPLGSRHHAKCSHECWKALVFRQQLNCWGACVESHQLSLERIFDAQVLRNGTSCHTFKRFFGQSSIIWNVTKVRGLP